MVLDVGPADFATMLTDWGRTIQKRGRAVTGTDSLGSPTYTTAAPVDVTAIVQDLRTDDKRFAPGILQPGDKQVFMAGTDTVGSTDEVTVDAVRYRVVEETTPKYGDAPVRPYNSYLVRKVAG